MGNDKKLSLRLIKFKEAVSDLLKVNQAEAEKEKAGQVAPGFY